VRKIREVKFNHQTLKFVYRDDSDASVIDEFFVDHMYRTTELQISDCPDVKYGIPTLCRDRFQILDIGAHIGVFSVYSSILLGLSDSRRQSEIIALEPEPNNFKLLKENIKLNNIKNVTPIQSALISGKETKTKLYLSKNTHNHSTNKPVNQPTSITVPAINLEQLMKQNKLSKIGLLKMDIEGAEFEIILNLKSLILNRIGNIAVEYHESAKHKRQDLENFLRPHGFSVEHFPNKFDKRFGLLVCRNKKFT
jgi:FkbM family methyltransferase